MLPNTTVSLSRCTLPLHNVRSRFQTSINVHFPTTTHRKSESANEHAPTPPSVPSRPHEPTTQSTSSIIQTSNQLTNQTTHQPTSDLAHRPSPGTMSTHVTYKPPRPFRNHFARGRNDSTSSSLRRNAQANRYPSIPSIPSHLVLPKNSPIHNSTPSPHHHPHPHPHPHHQPLEPTSPRPAQRIK